MILNSLTILTARVAAREALDCEASCATEEEVEVENQEQEKTESVGCRRRRPCCVVVVVVLEALRLSYFALG